MLVVVRVTVCDSGTYQLSAYLPVPRSLSTCYPMSGGLFNLSVMLSGGSMRSLPFSKPQRKKTPALVWERCIRKQWEDAGSLVVFSLPYK